MACGLPVTGANLSLLVPLAILLIATGTVGRLILDRRGVWRVAGIVIALTVGITALALSGGSRADADSCLPTTSPAVAAPVATTTTTTAVSSNTGPVTPIATSPGAVLPETSQVVALPVIALLVTSGYVVIRRRKNQATTR